MRVITKRCPVCGSNAVLDDVDALGFIRWTQLGDNIQEALPDLDDDQRELLLSGTHAHCWEKMWEGFGDD